MLRFGQVSRERGTSSGTGAASCRLWLAHLGLPCPGLGHVITPLWLIKMQLLLSISEYSQVCHRPLLAEIGGLCPLSCHTNSFAICLAVCLCAIRPFHFQISSASHTISKHAPCMRPYRKTSAGRNQASLLKPFSLLCVWMSFYGCVDNF
uniref:Uncharacterized protein n=1 Tax=Seriola dumerili TaxID=41447 RepID=A0A3B4T4M3_SERDU